MASDPASASLFDKHDGGATAATFVSGDPAQRRKQLRNLAQPSLKGAEGTIWWLVASPAAAASVRADLLSEHRFGRLDPGVMTLRQAADRLNRTARPALLPLGPAARRALINEIASKAEHRSSLGPLEELKESPGLVDFLASRFRQLRRDGIAAEQAGDTLRRLDGGRAGNVLANLYRDYLRALDRGGLIDDEGLIVQATARASLGYLTLTRLLVDLPLGVCPIEEQLVQAIADQADERFIACAGPIEDSTENAKLPASLRRRAGWSELLSVVDPEVLIEATPADRPAALKAIQNQLFDDQAESDRPADGVRVIAGSGQQDTARRVARHVKLMLTSGVAPSDLVLAAPNLERSAPRYAEALTEYGVPLAVDASPHLATASVTQIVLDLLALVETDWSFDSLTTLIRRNDLPKLGNNDTASGFSSARVATEWFVRELQVPSGQKYLQRQAEQIASRPDADDRLDRLREAARATVGVFEALAHALEGLPEEATALGWFDAIDTALRRLGHTGLTAAADPADRGAGDAIEEACASLENTARWGDRKPRRLRWRGMLELLRSWSTRLRLPNRDSSEGRVRLLGATTAAGLPCRHLIVVDADETAFTSALGDTDDAMLSFYELATTPTESLTFAYAALDASAQPMLPSPYVTEVERLFKADATRVENEPLLTTVAPERPPASIREWRQRAVHQALSGDAKDLAAYDRAADGKTGGLTTSLAAISARARGETFGVWEGVIEGTAAHAFLAERFGSQHLWSASQLELMATCPFKFFSRQVLRLDEAGELTLGIDHRRRGSLMHDALAECLTKIIDTLPPGKTLRDVPPDELSLRLSNQIDELCNTGKLPFHEAALAAIEARQTSDWAERYAEQQRRFHNDKRWNDLDQPLTPTLLEARFGPAKGEPDAAEDNRSTDQAFEFTLPSGEVLQLIGRIDRIDTARLGDQTLFSVVDYKTSKELKSTRAQMESGKQLQPILYAMAARELFLEDDAIPVAAGYWAVRKKGFVAPSDKELPLMTYDADGRVLPSDDWQDVVDTVRQRCETLVTDIRGGQFPMINDDEHCGKSCEFSTVCRVGQARSLNKLPPTTEGDAS